MTSTKVATTPPKTGVTSMRARSLPSLYAELTKARLVSLVLVTTAAGFVLGSAAGVQWGLLVWTLLGTGLVAGAANALNEILEAPRDARMRRTRGRPVPAGALGARHAFVTAVVLVYAGTVVLLLTAGPPVAGLALGTLAWYLLVYTPLKTRTTLNTLFGAVSGALPPLIGWVAAHPASWAGGWVLAGILFIWQVPHFLALAWMYREDYERGGFRMLPLIDPGGWLTARVALLTSLMLIPLGLVAVQIGLAGGVFAVGSIAMGLAFAWAALHFARRRNHATARRLFLASIAYLPLLLALLVLDRNPIVDIHVQPDPPGALVIERGTD